MLEKLGCRLCTNGLGQVTFEIGDPIAFRKQVEQHVRSDPSAGGAIAAHVLESVRGSRDVCEAAVRPLVPTRAGGVETGDSLCRLLLGVAAIQGHLGPALVPLIPEMAQRDDEVLALSLVGQFKWLENVQPDAGARMAEAFCDVLACEACSAELRSAIAILLPEIAAADQSQVGTGAARRC